jgi:hypothetical protein
MREQKFDTGDLRDVLLTDVAIRIQLSPTNHRLAVQRMETLAEWLERDDSELKGRVRLVYPQGSMAIRATIAACLRRDEFDIDVIAQLDLPHGTTPKQALDLLYRSIKGDKGSRYYSMTARNTRCVTVEYADMHVDITPAELVAGREPRVSHIFHHRAEEPGTPGKRIVANPFGFAEWFMRVVPRATAFEGFFEERSLAMDRQYKAETEETPEPIPAYLKPPAVIAHQLVKRFRNVRYEKREGRRPPSVMLACLMANFAGASGRPFAELMNQARALARYFGEHQSARQLVRVANPTCAEDVFSDRWPSNLDEQSVFLSDLRFLVTELERLERGADLALMADVFSKLFGEEISQSVVREFADRSGERIASGALRTDRSGRVDLSGSGILIMSGKGSSPRVETARTSPPHTFYGSDAD